MRAPYRERVMRVCNVRDQYQGSEERKRLEKIRCCLIHAIGQTAQRRHGLVAIAGRPAITALKTDEVRRCDQLQKAKNDAGREKS